MSGQTIHLKDVNDADQVVGALQRAMDVVLNAQTLRRLGGNPYGVQEYQHVHSSVGGPAVANVVMMKPMAEPQWTLFVHIFQDPNRLVHIPARVVRCLRVDLAGTRHSCERIYDRANQEFRFYLSLHGGVFIRNPKGIVRLV